MRRVGTQWDDGSHTIAMAVIIKRCEVYYTVLYCKWVQKLEGNKKTKQNIWAELTSPPFMAAMTPQIIQYMDSI